MPFQLPSDLQQSISAFVTNGMYQSEEEVLREAVRLLGQRQEDLASIQRGLDDIGNGQIQPAEDSNREFRRRHDIPSAQ